MTAPQRSGRAALVLLAGARLPDSYEEAKRALARCESLNELEHWTSKAAAIAAYARIERDDTLLNYAQRIKLRARRRVGELLVECDGRGRPPQKNSQATHAISQRAVANGAGMSKHRQDTAVRLAKIPHAQFEAAVESDRPPSVVTLAAMGRKPAPVGFKQATAFKGHLSRLAEFCARTPPATVARGMTLPGEVRTLRKQLEDVEAWIKRLAAEMEEATR
jgi:hypothetical protein